MSKICSLSVVTFTLKMSYLGNQTTYEADFGSKIGQNLISYKKLLFLFVNFVNVFLEKMAKNCPPKSRNLPDESDPYPVVETERPTSRLRMRSQRHPPKRPTSETAQCACMWSNGFQPYSCQVFTKTKTLKLFKESTRYSFLRAAHWIKCTSVGRSVGRSVGSPEPVLLVIAGHNCQIVFP